MRSETFHRSRSNQRRRVHPYVDCSDSDTSRSSRFYDRRSGSSTHHRCQNGGQNGWLNEEKSGRKRRRELSKDSMRGKCDRRRRNERQNENYNNNAKRSKMSPSMAAARSDRSVSNKSSIAVDKDGYLVMKQDQILGKRYKIVKLLGEGTFGRVAQCKSYKNQSQDVAVKVIKAVEKYREAAVLEIKVLDTIKKHDPHGRNLCIFALDWFDYHGHICISFPLLGPSVFDFLKANEYTGYPIRQVRYMAAQIIRAIHFLHTLKLTHTDLKPENILFVNGYYDLEFDERKQKHVKVIRDASLRIIDLGSATFDHEHHTTIVATRHYRPLEVILELGWSYPCDVWSVGCILFELFTGNTMFMTHDNTEHMAMMERILGRFPTMMIRKSKKHKYFDDCGRLKWDPESKAGRELRAEVKPLRRHIVNQDDIKELDLFDLIEEMLEYNPRKRITMKDARKHPFVSKFSQSSDKSVSRSVS